MRRPAAAGRGVRPGAFVERDDDGALAPLAAGDFAYVDPDEPAAHGRIVAALVDDPDGATRVRLMAV